MNSLAEALPAEINRVRELQKQYIGTPGSEPTIAMMENAITAAIEAQGSGNVITMIRAYDELKGYKE